MKINPKWGCPTDLTETLAQEIFDAVPRVLVLGQVAGLVKVPRGTLSSWIKRGEDDRQKNESSIFAYFSTGLRLAQALEVEKLMRHLKNAKGKNKSDSKWLLEKCFREDFGIESLQLQELVEIINILRQDIDNLKTNQGRGIVNAKKINEEGR